MSRDFAVASSVPEVASLVQPHLHEMNAVDAVVAGVLIAAARSSGVAMGSVQISVGGPGTGFHAIDGRVRQPGFGVARPRGFEDPRDVPAAARVAVPTFAPALAGVLGTFGTWTCTQVSALAMPHAAGSPRTAWLKLFAHRGGSLLVGTAIGEFMQTAGGRLAGGVVTADDLARATTEVHALSSALIEGDTWLHTVPWGEPGEDNLAHAHVIAAVDGRGTFAVATFEDRQDGVYVEELGMHLPGLAVPVMRGVPRMRPGEVLGGRASQGIVVRGGVACAALGLSRGAAVSLLDAALLIDAQMPGSVVGVRKDKIGASVL